VKHQLGDADAAIDNYQLAVTLYRATADRYSEARTWMRLGDTHEMVGRHGDALRAWRSALAVFDEFRQPEAEQVRERLAGAIDGHTGLAAHPRPRCTVATCSG
jgi:tetratricopeptide (TPR) repeat protein